jgi:hypothetical protein
LCFLTEPGFDLSPLISTSQEAGITGIHHPPGLLQTFLQKYWVLFSRRKQRLIRVPLQAEMMVDHQQGLLLVPALSSLLTTEFGHSQGQLTSKMTVTYDPRSWQSCPGAAPHTPIVTSVTRGSCENAQSSVSETVTYDTVTSTPLSWMASYHVLVRVMQGGTEASCQQSA